MLVVGRAGKRFRVVVAAFLSMMKCFRTLGFVKVPGRAQPAITNRDAWLQVNGLSAPRFVGDF